MSEVIEPTSTEPEVAPPEDPEESDNGVEEETPPDVILSTDRLWALLDALVPDDETVVKDVDGTEYRLPCVLPARKQVKVFRGLKKLLALQTEIPAVKGIADAVGSGQIANALGSALDALEDERVFDALDESFQAAFPEVRPESCPSDVFSIEEMMSALLPFCIRLARRIGGVLKPVTQAMVN